MRAAALVLAAGKGVRLGEPIPKAFVRLGGKTLLERSLETLCRVPLLCRVVPVLPPDDVGASLAAVVSGADKLAEPVPGGARRQDSVAAGLASLPDDIEWVAVHDAARCLVSVEEVEAVLRGAQETGAAILARPSPDTLKLVRDGVIVSTPERSACWAAQTPQVFRVGLLREGLEKAKAEGFTATDDAQLVERSGISVRIVEGRASNLKITHPADLAVAEALLAQADQEAPGASEPGAPRARGEAR
jgi:2-C-methyl-D-erythritol 4-phosphate cytidylyltransferase